MPDMLAGRTIDEVGRTTSAVTSSATTPSTTTEGWHGQPEEAKRSHPDLDRVVHCSFGDYPAREYLWQANYFRGVRAYDIAKLIGTAPALSEGLVQGLWEGSVPTPRNGAPSGCSEARWRCPRTPASSTS